MRLLSRVALAIGCSIVALCIDVLVNVVASRAWPWTVSLAVIIAAATVGVGVDALRQRLKSVRREGGTKLAAWPGDDGLVVRPEEMTQIVTAIKNRRPRPNVVILWGPGGYGKSTLALVAATDPRVSRKFSRSFRVAYGEASVDDFAIAGIVNGLVEQITGLRPGHTDSAAAAQHLSQVLRQAGRVLLVIDGVWTQRQLLPFLVGAKLCVRLVTTRNQELLLENTTPVLVGPMSADQARELLSRGLPPDTVASLTESGILDLAVSGAWRWPLVLAILNKVLLARVREGRSPAEALRGIFDHVSVHGLRSADELRVAVAPEESELVRRALESGLALLNVPDAKERLRDLAVFPPPVQVPVDLVAELWAARSSSTVEQAKSLCSQMAALSFFTISNGSVQLHEVMYEFIRGQLDEHARIELAGMLLDAMSPQRPGDESTNASWWDVGSSADYLGEHVVRLMMEAGRPQEAEASACDLRWIQHRLSASGITAVLADLTTVGTDRARRLGAAVERIGHLLGGITVRPDAGQFLLNALRNEPEWALQAVSLQAGVIDPILVSQWPLPDNPGPPLRHVYKVPSPKTDSQAMALSPDGSWLAVAANDYPDSAYAHAMSLILMAANRYGGSDIFIFDISTGLIRSTVRSDRPIRRMTISADGRRIAAIGHGTLACFDAETGSIVSESCDHDDRSSVAFTPDGTGLITIGGYGRVALWDAATGQRISSEHGDDFSTFCHDPPRFRESVDAIASADGAWVISGGRYGVFTWTIPDGQQFKAFSVDGYPADGYSSARPFIWRVVAAPDRSWVAGSSDDKIYVWATDTGEMIATLDASGRLTALAVSPDGSLLASGDYEGTVLVWETRQFTLTGRLGRHAGMSSLAFSPDGQLLYSGGGGEARAWQLSMATSSELPPEGIPAETVVMSPTGAWVAVATQGGDVHIRDVASGQELATLAGHAVSAHIAIAPDGTWLATEAGGTISVWNGNWTLARRFYIGAETGDINSIHASADSRQLFTVDAIAVRAWDPRSGKLLATMANFTESVESLAFSQDGSWLAAGDYYGTIWVWDARTGDLLATLGGGYNHARCKALTATPNGSLLARAYHTIETWDVQQGALADEIGFQGGWDVAISPDRGCVIDGTGGAVVRYDLDPAEPRRFTKRGEVGHFGWGSGPRLAFSGDGRWFAVGLDVAVEVWDRSAHRVRVRLPGNDHRPIALSFRGDKVAYASYDGIAILKVSTSEVVQELRLAKKKYDSFHISSLAVSPDDGWLAIVSGDKVSVVDMTSGDVRGIVGDLGTVRAAAFSPGGQYAAIAGSDGGRVWDTRTARPLAGSRWRGAADSLLLGPADEWLAIGAGRVVTIFALPGGERLHEFAIPHMGQDRIRRILSIPHGAQIVIQTWASLIIADLNNEAFTTIGTGRDAVDVMAISPDGLWLATGGQDLAVLSLRDGSLVTSHPVNRPVKSIDWSPASDSIVAGGDGGAYLLLFKNRPE